MRLFAVYAKRKENDIVVVSDKFSFFALCTPYIWLLWHGLWQGFLLFSVLSGAINWLFLELGAGFFTLTLINFILSLFVAMNASLFLEISLIKRGYELLDIVMAPTKDMALVAYLYKHGSL